MLSNPTIETLQSLKLQGMIQALEEQQQTPAIHGLSFDKRLALIVDRERLHRDNHRRTRLLRGARLKVAEACIEDINYKAARGLDKQQIATLATGEGCVVPRICSSPAPPVPARPEIWHFLYHVQ
jgi:DNA replication protein DnaC